MLPRAIYRGSLQLPKSPTICRFPVPSTAISQIDHLSATAFLPAKRSRWASNESEGSHADVNSGVRTWGGRPEDALTMRAPSGPACLKARPRFGPCTRGR